MLKNPIHLALSEKICYNYYVARDLAIYVVFYITETGKEKEDYIMISLLPHNKEAVAAVQNGLRQTNRVCVCNATGSGKSYIAMKLIENAVAEDRTVNMLYVTSYDTNLKEFIGKVRTNIGHVPNMHYALYSTMRPEKYKNISIIILDEFHRVGAQEWGKKVMTTIQKNPNARIVGFSATPVRYLDNRRNMATELFDDNIVYELSLRDAIVQGVLPCPHYTSCLIEVENIIRNYEKRKKTNRVLSTDTEFNLLLDEAKRNIAQAPGVEKVLTEKLDYQTGKYLVFCRNLEHMNEIADCCKEWFSHLKNGVRVYTVHSRQKTDEEYKAFLNDDSDCLRLLLCINMLNEGTHIPNIDGAILLRPTDSMNVYLQQVGRALSAAARSIPQIIDIVDNTVLMKPAMEMWRDTISSLKRQGKSDREVELLFDVSPREIRLLDILTMLEDMSVWDDWYALAENWYVEHGDLNIPKQYKTPEGLKLGRWLVAQRYNYHKGTLLAERKQALDKLHMVWDTFDYAWADGYRHAKEYFEAHGNLKMRNDYVCQDGYALGQWLNTNKDAYKKGKITEERFNALNRLGIIWNYLDYAWEIGYAHAKEFYLANGHLKMSYDYVCNDGYKLGSWIGNQRSKVRNAEKNGCPSVLSNEQKKRLDDIGMDWNPYETSKELGYAHAEEFFRKNGNLSVPDNYVSEDGFLLGRWLARKRVYYRKGRLSEEEIKRLESLHFVKTPLSERKRKLWEKGYAHAEAFFKEHGTLRVGSRKCPDGYCLTYWLTVQRKSYKEGTLPEEYIQRLNKLNMPWDKVGAFWEEGFDHAKQYLEEFGDLRIPVQYVCPDGFLLGGWITKRRLEYSTNVMTEEQIRRLDSLGMVWDVRDAAWEEGIAHAKAYFDANGHLNVQDKYVADDGYKLGKFVRHQRYSRSINRLTEEKIEQLNSVGMVWDIKTDMWANAYKHAKAYFEEHGNIEKMPKGYRTEDGNNLYAWLYLQRKHYRLGKLSAERIALLEALDIDWKPRSFEDMWEDSYALAEAYFKEHGDLLPLALYRTEDDKPLGNWILRQRKLYRDGLLSDDQIERLNRIGMVWKLVHRRTKAEIEADAKA